MGAVDKPAWHARWRRWALAGLFACVFPAVASAMPDSVRLGGARVQVLEDPGGRMGLEQVRRADARFRPLRHRNAIFGYTRSAWWLRVALAPEESGAGVLGVEYPLLDRVDLWVLDDGALRRHAAAGQALAFAQRDYASGYPAFALPADRGGQRVLYLRVQGRGALRVPLALHTARGFVDTEHAGQLLLGVVYGMLGALLVYNLFLYVSLRDRNHLRYVLYAGAVGLLLFSLDGFAFQFLWPRHPGWNEPLLRVAIALFVLTMVQFSRRFLGLAQVAPRSSRALGALLLAQVLALALGLPGWVDDRALAHIQDLLVLAATVAVLAAALLCARRGRRHARTFLLAWFAALAGASGYALMLAGVLPHNLVSAHGVQLGAGAEMLLLSFALAQRIRAQYRRHLEMLTEARDTFERRVEERTRELNLAMARLADTNRSLRDSSARDALTGIYNRRYFEQALDVAWEEARAHRKPLSLLLIDLDRFKPVNDLHGHLAGDACLREVAACLRQALAAQPDALVARYGGDEFAALCPGLDMLRAGVLAERLLAAVDGARIAPEGCEPVGASIGVAACTPATGEAVHDLIAAADEALYRAKREGGGRHRVTVRPLPGTRTDESTKLRS